jgi:hypothetical protein
MLRKAARELRCRAGSEGPLCPFHNRFSLRSNTNNLTSDTSEKIKERAHTIKRMVSLKSLSLCSPFHSRANLVYGTSDMYLPQNYLYYLGQGWIVQSSASSKNVLMGRAPDHFIYYPESATVTPCHSRWQQARAGDAWLDLGRRMCRMK